DRGTGGRMNTSNETESTSFEDSLRELGEIVESLESGDVGLAEALSRYEKGVTLLKACHQMLEKVERRIELLSGFDADGNPVCEPFDDESSLARSEQE